MEFAPHDEDAVRPRLQTWPTRSHRLGGRARDISTGIQYIEHRPRLASMGFCKCGISWLSRCATLGRFVTADNSRDQCNLAFYAFRRWRRFFPSICSSDDLASRADLIEQLTAIAAASALSIHSSADPAGIPFYNLSKVSGIQRSKKEWTNRWMFVHFASAAPGRSAATYHCTGKPKRPGCANRYCIIQQESAPSLVGISIPTIQSDRHCKCRWSTFSNAMSKSW